MTSYNILFLLSSLLFTICNSYNWLYGNITLYHSESTYCDPNSYLTRQYKEPLDGFIPSYSIYDIKYDTHGYIGYQPNKKLITVAYRGSESIENWLSDLDAILTEYPYCIDCAVHKGFMKQNKM